MAHYRTLLFLLVLCAFCIAAGFQSDEAYRQWLAEGAASSPSAKVWSTTAKAAALLLFAIAILGKLTTDVFRRGPP